VGVGRTTDEEQLLHRLNQKKLLGFCQLAAVAGLGANFLANVALANSLGGSNSGLTDALLLSGGLGGGFGGGGGGGRFGVNAALNTAITANALGSLGGSGNNNLLGAALLANNLSPQFNANGNFYYSSGYYAPPTTSYLPTYYDTTYLPTYLPTTYLPTTTYLPPATTYWDTTYLPPATTYWDTTYLPTTWDTTYTSPYVGLGVGSYGCWVNGVWMASCFV
jgi:hypothetical protein